VSAGEGPRREGPLVSIVVPTYNRAQLVPRAIDSVLRQDYPRWELIVVDDGSTDGTDEVLARYRDERIRVVRHPRNRGATAAKNTGLGEIRGEWFTILDSDDELVEDALSALVAEIERDPTLAAITCNCRDSVTGELTGRGLERSQILDYETMIRVCDGEHFGITKTSLLGEERFKEDMLFEGEFWFRIGRGARRLYLHRALRIYHSEGQDRVSRSGIERKGSLYRALEREGEFLDLLERCRPADFAGLMFNVGLVAALEGRRRDALRAARRLGRARSLPRALLIALAGLSGSLASRAMLRVGRGLAATRRGAAG
jgi:glycosyltransferase involved in cell wall biosynthesis